jgi:hypothetical protein
MDPISLTAAVLTVGASALSAITKIVSDRRKKRGLAINSRPGPYRTSNTAPAPGPPQPPVQPQPGISAGIVVLVSFAVIILIFGAFSVFYYWPLISANGATLMFALWLFFAMVAGMFVQVLAANYRAGRPLFDVSASQLVFPLLFALIIYYPIWSLAASSPHNLFSFYAAFLNGYFWESVVSAAKSPVPNPPGPNDD